MDRLQRPGFSAFLWHPSPGVPDSRVETRPVLIHAVGADQFWKEGLAGWWSPRLCRYKKKRQPGNSPSALSPAAGAIFAWQLMRGFWSRFATSLPGVSEDVLSRAMDAVYVLSRPGSAQDSCVSGSVSHPIRPDLGLREPYTMHCCAAVSEPGEGSHSGSAHLNLRFPTGSWFSVRERRSMGCSPAPSHFGINYPQVQVLYHLPGTAVTCAWQAVKTTQGNPLEAVPSLDLQAGRSGAGCLT